LRILVVEDEPAIADFIRRGLQAEGYVVDCAPDGEEGERRALGGDVDLVILDVMLPGQDGMGVLDMIRQRKPALPVIMLTARGEVTDKVAALDAGATDYVTKPFSFDELAARVRAHLRMPDQGRTTQLAVGSLALDLLTRRVQREGHELNLSAREFDLLAYFLRHPRRVLTRDQVFRAVWGTDFMGTSNIIDANVYSLRARLEADGRPRLIQTVRGVGYTLRPQ